MPNKISLEAVRHDTILLATIDSDIRLQPNIDYICQTLSIPGAVNNVKMATLMCSKIR